MTSRGRTHRPGHAGVEVRVASDLSVLDTVWLVPQVVLRAVPGAAGGVGGKEAGAGVKQEQVLSRSRW